MRDTVSIPQVFFFKKGGESASYNFFCPPGNKESQISIPPQSIMLLSHIVHLFSKMPPTGNRNASQLNKICEEFPM